MRGWLAIAAVGVAFVATSAWAQMRGGRAAFGGSRPAIVGHAPIGRHGTFIPHRAPGFSPVPMYRRPFIGRGFHAPFVLDHRVGFRHHERGLVISFGWPYAYYGFYPGYYPYYPSYPLFWESYDNSISAYTQQNLQLQQQVDDLSNELEQLREDEAAERNVPPPSPPQQLPPQAQTNAPPPSPTTLVFRDGRTEKVNNYAVAGSTLWVFNERRARKVPLAELDIAATEKANEERGVPFQVPRPAH